MTQLNNELIRKETIQLANDGPTVHTTKYETKVPTLHKSYLLFFSLIISALTIAVPFFTDAANSLQSQNLYIGMMLTKGQIPYSDVFTTGGLLYFVVIALSYYLGTTLWLVFVQAFCFYLSGLYLYKLINYFTSFQKVALAFSIGYYVLSLGLGFGGLYPIQLAMPFVLVSAWFLTKYFADLIKDEAFILFGFMGALSMLIEPRTLIFWVLACVTVLVYNIHQKHLARGFYQLLASVWGMILVFYTAGYFILNLQILNPYLAQAVAYQFTFFRVGDLSLPLGVGIQILLALGLGLLTGVFSFIKQLKTSSDVVIKWLFTFVILGNLIVAALSQDYQPYHLLAVLPFGLILTAIPIGQRYELDLGQRSHRRHRGSRTGVGRVLSLYLKKHFYLPFVLLLAAIAYPSYHTITSMATNQERSHIASYLQQQLDGHQPIYVWDDTSKIYLESKAKSVSQFSSPNVNTKKVSHQKILEDELLENEAVYIVVNQKMKLPTILRNMLSSNYKIDQKIDVKGFTLYHKK
ncbi:DUF2079 domain-containing protein [Streptococcus dysgalactiae subsp. dysgalactiae]|uniref:hypothetical protein n=1 Tax=Streptococcus dysgalactiae TaxID=1334 RepID=UPI000219D1B7|nr:hypothetical protein [Streptococcus dysgalactiae]EGR87421.1 conserved domain protein [Streptococcus dysgalactiae subsp. equisimilis SK1250]KKC21957.1 membrane protein [Streptococcus dysgalactiae subsp. equisimilis]MBM6514290.1 DUF2079 domain-containing protein [Streptococcus dysgalactiae subsp. equisimilis]MBM6533375.1 DUF2079 domain-containing protein [Streptococcus dysgalactiae subsp. equisimilis]MBM6548337.1 DUF2079 domain-containing protein [Streptococcus dysgalactiae subsp. equisimilis